MTDERVTFQTLGDSALRVETELKATPERVYAAWTRPEQFQKWFGPRAGSLRVDRFDPSVGGGYDVTLLFDDGDRVRLEGEYLELDPPRRLVFTWLWTDGPTRSNETRVTIDLAPSEIGTSLTLTHERFLSTEARDGHGQGWGSMFDLLASYLAL